MPKAKWEATVHNRPYVYILFPVRATCSSPPRWFNTATWNPSSLYYIQILSCPNTLWSQHALSLYVHVYGEANNYWPLKYGHWDVSTYMLVLALFPGSPLGQTKNHLSKSSLNPEVMMLIDILPWQWSLLHSNTHLDISAFWTPSGHNMLSHCTYTVRQISETF